PVCRVSMLLEDNRQQVVAGPESDGRVTVTRKTFVPANGSFVRMVDSVTNPTASDVTITMLVTAALPHVFGGSGAAVSPSAVHVADGDSRLSYGWTVTIPAGQTISVMQFSEQ